MATEQNENGRKLLQKLSKESNVQMYFMNVEVYEEFVPTCKYILKILHSTAIQLLLSSVSS